MKNLFPFLLMCFALMAACISKLSDNEFMIEGKLENASDKMVILKEIQPEQIVNVDTVFTNSKGKFSFRHEMSYQSLYIIELNNVEYITLLPNFGETIKIAGDYDAFSKTYTVNGSQESTRLWEMNKETLKGIALIDSLSGIWSVAAEGENANEVKKQLDNIYMHELEAQREYTLSFINSHTGSLSSLIALYRTFNQVSLLDKHTDFSVYQKIETALQKNLPSNPHTLVFSTLVEALKDTPPEQTQPNSH